MKSIPAILRFVLATIAAMAAAQAADKYLFAYFMNNGETGVYFAISDDGYHYRPLNNGKPWLPPAHQGQLMRDPYLARDSKGGFHMVWTWGWTGNVFGHAHSRDLLAWGEQIQTPALPGVEGVKNTWAPELTFDAKSGEWIVFWSATVAGRFPESAASLDNGNNHRIYARSTRDFKSFSETWLLFDPGYPVIDASIVPGPSSFDMYFKDERVRPLRKRILRATGPTVRGPWTVQGDAFTEEWSEGPSALVVGNHTVVFYDHYRDVESYRAMRSRDRTYWQNATPLISFPPKSKHGSFLKITAEEAARLDVRRD
jgi:hypothetical protein